MTVSSTFVHDLKKLINRSYYTCHCVCQISLQFSQCHSSPPFRTMTQWTLGADGLMFDIYEVIIRPINYAECISFSLVEAEWRIYASVKWPSLFQIMACRLVDAKPLSDPMLEYCWLDHQEQTSVKFKSEFKHFHSRKCTRKCRQRNGVHFVSASMC